MREEGPHWEECGDDLKISNAKEEFMLCSHHHCGTRKKAKRKKERGREVPILRALRPPRRRRSGVEEDERISRSF